MGAGYATVTGDHRDDADAADRRRARNLDNPLQPLRATTINEALDLGFQLLRSRFALLAGLTATLFLPIQLLDLILRLTWADQAEQVNQFSLAMGFSGAGDGSGWVLITFLLQRVAQSLLGMSCGYLAMAMIRGESPGYRSVLGATLKRLWVAPVLLALVWMLLGVGLFVAGVGVLLFASWTFAASVVAGAEQLGPFGAFKRCFSLSRTCAGPAMMFLFGIGFLGLMVRGITYVGPAVLLEYLGMPEAVRVIVEQLSMLLLLVGPMLTACLVTTAYLSMRTRSEGLDLMYRISSQLGDADGR